MARKESDPLVPDPVRGGLKHTPLSALRALNAKPGTAAEIERSREASESAASRRPPAEERVSVRRERAGRGGKIVTIAEGPGLAASDLDALAREAARALGVGARIELVHEARALVVQGDQSERLSTWLAARGFRSLSRGN